MADSPHRRLASENGPRRALALFSGGHGFDRLPGRSGSVTTMLDFSLLGQISDTAMTDERAIS